MDYSGPIFVIDRDGGDVLAFEKSTAAEGFMEVPEVESNGYLVLDGDGRVADLAIVGWDVSISSWSAPSPERLRQHLAPFIRAHGGQVSAKDSIAKLVEDAFKIARDAELARTRPRFLVPIIRWLNRR